VSGIGRLGRRVAARWRVPVVLALIGALTGAAVALAERPEYRSGASVVPAERGEPDVDGAYDASDPETLDRLVQIARGRDVARQAAAALGGDLTGAQVLSRTGISPGPGGSIAIRVTAEEPALPPAVADAYADAIVEVVDERERRRLSDAEEQLSEQLLELDPLSEEYAELEDRIAAIAEARALGPPLEPGRTAGEAQSLGTRSIPAWAAAGAVIGGLLGLLAAALAGLRPRRRERLGGAAAFAAVSGLDPIVLPRIDDGVEAGEGRVLLSGRGGEALREIARELGLLAEGEGTTSVAVCSPDRAEGRTSTALGLAAAAAEAGRRAVLVEADLVHPALAERLRLEPEPGLGEFLAGDARPSEIVRRLRVGADGDRTGMLCTVAGAPRPEQAGELLGGRRLRVLVERLTRAYDVIVLDTPPLLDAEGGAAIAALADRALLLAVAGRTRAERLQASLPALPEYLNGVLLGGPRRLPGRRG
jgi:polysaccharide biosynthesis transport protein